MGLLMSALVLLLTLTLGGPAAVAQSTTVRVSGNSAFTDSCSPQSATTVECIEVSVFAPGGPMGAAGQTQTLLFYDDSIADASTLSPIQDMNGSGLIPNTAFLVQATPICSMSTQARFRILTTSPAPSTSPGIPRAARLREES